MYSIICKGKWIHLEITFKNNVFRIHPSHVNKLSYAYKSPRLLLHIKNIFLFFFFKKSNNWPVHLIWNHLQMVVLSQKNHSILQVGKSGRTLSQNKLISQFSLKQTCFQATPPEPTVSHLPVEKDVRTWKPWLESPHPEYGILQPLMKRLIITQLWSQYYWISYLSRVSSNVSYEFL